jgi:hypothetical protein
MDDKPQNPFDPNTSGPLKGTEKVMLYSGYVIIACMAIPVAALILSWLLSRP